MTLGRFVTAEELSADLRERHGLDIPAERLLELAESHHLPSVVVRTGDEVLFEPKAAKRWIGINLLSRRPGEDFPARLCIWNRSTLDDATVAHRSARPGLPTELADMRDALNEFDLGAHSHFPCVYFLILGDEVVYVGQTDALSRRIEDHRTHGDGRCFDRVVYLRVPRSRLRAVEAQFIDALRPRHNTGPEKREEARRLDVALAPLFAAAYAPARRNGDGA